MLPVNIDRYHTTNRTATCNRPVFVGVRGSGLGKYVYDNELTVMERISGTLLMSHNSITSNFFIFRCFLQSPITPIGLCKKRLLTLFLHVPIILPPINDRLTLKIFHIDSPSYPPPHLRHLAKSLPVPSGMTPTLG